MTPPDDSEFERDPGAEALIRLVGGDSSPASPATDSLVKHYIGAMFKQFKRMVLPGLPTSSGTGNESSPEDDKRTLMLIAEGKIDPHGVLFRNFYLKAFKRACIQLRGLGVSNIEQQYEIAQEAGQALIPGRCTYVGRSSPWTWYFIVVTRTWAKWVHDQYRHREVFDENAVVEPNDFDPEDYGAPPEESLEFKRYRECIMDAARRFAKLKRTDNPDDIVILQMLVLGESPIKDVADRLGIKYGATQQRLARVKKQFERLAQRCAGYL